MRFVTSLRGSLPTTLLEMPDGGRGIAVETVPKNRMAMRERAKECIFERIVECLWTTRVESKDAET
jgi:hypothetical protein